VDAFVEDLAPEGFGFPGDLVDSLLLQREVEVQREID
jgi:hypothetical protein